MRFAWKLLIAAGTILIAIALVYNTTVETGLGKIHNIGLQSERQMLMMLGCFLLLAGVILFSVAKLKQTPEEAQREREELQAAEDLATRKREEARAKVKAASNSLYKMRPRGNKWGVRLAVGLLVGWYWMVMFVLGARSLEWGTLAFFVGLYACFTGANLKATLGIILTITSALAALALATSTLGSEVPLMERLDAEWMVKAALLFVLPGIASFATGQYLLKKAEAEPTPEPPSTPTPAPAPAFRQVDLQGNLRDLTRSSRDRGQ